MSADQSELIMQYETDLANKDRRIAELEGALTQIGYTARWPSGARRNDLAMILTSIAGVSRKALSALNSQQVSK